MATLTGAVVGSLGFVANWWLVFDHQSYFVSTGRQPMLQHMWSLAIEEQFYHRWRALTSVGSERSSRRILRSRSTA